MYLQFINLKKIFEQTIWQILRIKGVNMVAQKHMQTTDY